MLRRLVPFALLLLAACQSSSPAPEKSEAAPHAPAAAVAPVTQQADTRPVIVTFGDSLTAGYGMPPGKSYPDFLQRQLDAAGYSYHIVNEGISGDTSTGALVRVESVIAENPEIVIVAFGGNDGLRGLAVESMEANLRHVIERLQEAGAKVVLGGMKLPPNYGAEYVNSFEAVYPKLAKELNVALVPFLLEGVAARPELLYDEIHPNEKGNEIVAGVVMRTLEPLLKK